MGSMEWAVVALEHGGSLRYRADQGDTQGFEVHEGNPGTWQGHEVHQGTWGHSTALRDVGSPGNKAGPCGT